MAYGKEKKETLGWYNFVAKEYSEYSDWTFMNYGYAELDEQPGSEINHCLELYRQVIANMLAEECDVLEVGCGRGGGSEFMLKEFTPKSLTAIDISLDGIRFCSKRLSNPTLRFLNADAERLPFESNSFDAVVNVESSHCYPHYSAFVSEVYRVLKPGGHFLFTDFRMIQTIYFMRNDIVNAGFEILDFKDITKNVVHSLTLDGDVKLAEIVKHVPIPLRSGFRQFAALPGTSGYDLLAMGWQKYWRFVCRKPG